MSTDDDMPTIEDFTPQNVTAHEAEVYLRACGWVELPDVGRGALWFRSREGLQGAMPRGRAVVKQFREDWQRAGFVLVKTPRRALTAMLGNAVALCLGALWPDMRTSIVDSLRLVMGPERFAEWERGLAEVEAKLDAAQAKRDREAP